MPFKPRQRGCNLDQDEVIAYAFGVEIKSADCQEDVIPWGLISRLRPM